MVSSVPVVEEIRADELAELRVRDSAWPPPHCKHRFDSRIVQTLDQDPSPDHSGGAE